MKTETKELLEKEILNNKVKYKRYDKLSKKFHSLYQQYLTSEVDSVEELFDILPKNNSFNDKNLEYMNLLGQNFSRFQVSKNVVENSTFDDFSDLMSTILFCSVGRYAISDYRFNESKKFVNIVNGIVEDSVSLLDVGSGTLWPVSSLQFLSGNKQVTTMDDFGDNWYRFDLFEKLGLKVKSEYFTKSTNIKDYDSIVGSAPCSAIIPIVEKCAKVQDKEYVINMCACCSPTGGMTGFVEYLRDKDENLKCFVSRTNADTHKHEVFEAKDEKLTVFDDVYVTNSPKHKDDILQVIYENFCGESEENFENVEMVK